MLRLLLLIALALVATIPVPPASAATAPTPATPALGTTVASEDEDPGDEWGEEDPGDEWADEEVGDEWADDELCLAEDEWGDWSEEELASAAHADDDEDGDWPEEPCADGDEGEEGEDAAVPAPVRLSALRATPARHGKVRVRFRLDRGTPVTLTLQRLRGARASGKPRALHGRVSVAGREGANATTLRRWNGRGLQPGSYRLTATPATSGAPGTSTTFTLRLSRR